MRGFIEGGLKGNDVAKEEFYRRALDVIEWGRSTWKDVPKDDRGTIFDETFLRGLRAMHMEALMEVRADSQRFNPMTSLSTSRYLRLVRMQV
jgi:hypothetical protein